MTLDLLQDSIASELSALMARGAGESLPDAEFDRLARAVFAAQFEACAPYRNFCERRGRTPESTRSWLEIPAVPVSAFKEIELRSDSSDPVRVFHTTGTTQSRPGRHFLSARALELYRASMVPTFRCYLLPELDDNRRTSLLPIVFAPSSEQAPHSSLSFMIDGVCHAFCADPSSHVFGAGGLDSVDLGRVLARSEKQGRPALLLGTSLAFLAALEWLDSTRRRYFLPEGSRVMETGGPKGSRREIDPAVLRQRMTDAFGIEESSIVNEYGMTEACSQFYDASLLEAREESACALEEKPESEGARLKHGSPWVRAVVCDPETLEPAEPGGTGVLRIVDLANRFTLSFLQTEDLATADERAGPFRLIGRAQGAEARGCSLAAEEWLRATERAPR